MVHELEMPLPLSGTRKPSDFPVFPVGNVQVRAFRGLETQQSIDFHHEGAVSETRDERRCRGGNQRTGGVALVGVDDESGIWNGRTNSKFRIRNS